MREWKWMGMAGIAALVVALAAPADAQQCPKGKLRIYTSWPMQGAMLTEGTGMKNGVDMAVAEVGGVVAGYCLEVVNLDDASPQTGKWDGAVEAENANKAVADPLAIVYIGTYNSGAAKVSIPINNRAHMAQITPANTYPGPDQEARRRPRRAGDLPARRASSTTSAVPPPTTSRARWRAKWAKQLGAKKVYILNDQELYGKGIADVFEAAAKKIGLQVAANEGIDYKQPDQKPLLTKVRASGADLVYLARRRRHGRPDHPPPDEGARPRGRAAASGCMGPDGLYEEEVLKAGDLRRRARHRDAHHLRRPALREDEGRRREDLRELQEEVRQGADRLRALLGRVGRGSPSTASSARPPDIEKGARPDGEARGRPEGHRRDSRTTRA